MVELTVIIISYNTRDLTLACLESVFVQTRQTDFEIVVFDNASEDGSPDAIAVRFPEVRLIRSDRNVGFASGNGLAAAEARGQWLLLLNPDTVILDGAIDRALTFARQQEAACIVGGRTFFSDGRLNRSSCHGAPTPWSLLCMGTGISSLFRHSRLFNPESLGRWPRDSVREVDAVSGCFLLLRCAVWRQLGGFDESFFMYGEDLDLCLRARQLGVRCLVCPQAKLIHHGGMSERVHAEKMVRLFRAKRQLFEKHWSPAWTDFGAAMLAMWAFTRMTGIGAICLVDARRREAYKTWREIWRRRSSYAGRPSAGENL